MDIPEIALEVLARLPLKSIARFRSVKKEWKLLIDSELFRDYFISLNSSSSISWSIVKNNPYKLTLEIVGHHGCKVLGLIKSPGSLVSFFIDTKIREAFVLACTDGLVLIFAKTNDDLRPMFYIGNTLFQEWFRIPLPTYLIEVDSDKYSEVLKELGLVTKMQSGVLLRYKIFWLVIYDGEVEFMVYSSDTGIWEMLNVTCRLRSNLRYIQRNSISLNGILHWIYNLTSSIVAYDFYGGYNDGVDNDECRIIHFPSSGKDERFRRTFTTSAGFIVYLNEFLENENRTLRVWRLVKYTDVVAEAWQLFWEVNLVSLMELCIFDYFPVLMHPLNSEIIYLWTRNQNRLILYNLRTHVFSIHKETEVDSKCMDGCVLSFNDCSEYMETNYGFISSVQDGPSHLLFSQYVLPRWLHRPPPPPPPYV